ncbi:DUF3376 domain-containing protein [Kocuria turfanensis]|uniref:DUF3376 domain-containing protein n=1 Tax=Kocuria turfanensis TaxID=388357 RepID=UPI004036D0B0
MPGERAGAHPEERAPGAGLRLTVLPPDRRPAEVTAGQPPAFGRTLRFALAMRGGVSLAVWIGGAVAELDLLRRIRIHRDPAGGLHAVLLQPSAQPDPHTAERARVYAGLLADAGYDRVEFDLLAGASAGGLNSVVHAVAQRAGTGLSALGLLWQEHAALGRLLRPLGRAPVDSLLQGDAYLWPCVQELLATVHGDPGHHPDLVAEHVSVDLSATVLDSDPSFHSGAAEGRGGFHFSSPEPGCPAPPLGNDIPARPGAPGGTAEEAGHRAASLARLAYAARATSSFPGAFEPAAVWSAPTAGRLGGFPRPDLSHAFSAHRGPEGLPFRVIDGGVFDNIPIDRAVAAAGTRTSLRHADRCLLYLDPDPPAPREVRAGDLDLPRLVRTLGATVTRLRRRETGEDEVLALADRRDDRLVADGRLHPLAALSVAWDPASREDRRRAYVRYRARADAALLARLLTRPAQWQLASTLPRRQEVHARGAAELEPLRQELAGRYDVLSRGPLTVPDATAVLRGPQALADAASCVLAWVRFLESLLLDPGPGPVPPAGFDPAPARAVAYRVLAAAGHARDGLFAAVLEVCEDPGAPVTAAVPVWLDAASPASGTGKAAWRELDAAVAALRGAHAAVQAQTGADHGADGGPGAAPGDAREAGPSTLWRESPWSAVPVSGPVPAAADLPPLFAAAGIPTPVSGISYGEIRGDGAPARPAALGPLPRAWARQRLQRALDASGRPGVTDDELRRLLAPDAGRLPARDKLAGAGLFNFRGFLAADWRANDWWWGRLDAAAGAAAFLRALPARSEPTTDPRGSSGAPAASEPAPRRPTRKGPGPEDSARPGAEQHVPGPDSTCPDSAGQDGAQQDSAQQDSAEQDGSGSHSAGQDGPGQEDAAPHDRAGGHPARESAAALQESLLDELGGGDRQHALATLGAGADGLARLAPGYRISLASRGLRVLGRALAGTPDLPRGVWELLLFLAQPVLVLVPLLLAPVRAALGFVAAAVALGLLGAPDPGGRAGELVLAGAGAVLLAAALLRTVHRAHRGWSRVLEAAGGSPPAALADAGAARDAALRRAGCCGAAAAGLLLPAAAAATTGRTVLVLLLLTGVLGLERCAAAVALRVPGREPVDEVVRASGVVLAAVAGWALVALVVADPVAVRPGGGPALLGVAAAGAALGALVLAGFLRPGWAALVAGAAALTAAAVLGAVGALTDRPGAGPAAALLGWAAVLWWAPREGTLRRWERSEELHPPGGRPARG